MKWVTLALAFGWGTSHTDVRLAGEASDLAAMYEEAVSVVDVGFKDAEREEVLDAALELAAGQAELTGVIVRKATKLQMGYASYYANVLHGRLTANGERYDRYERTAAHKTLPFGTRVYVINPRNGRSVMVRINDRGPFIGERVLDLSYAAARDIGLLRRGVGTVEYRILSGRNPQ